jgi:hypothetical protein
MGMLKIVDRILIGLLLLGGVGHTLGSFKVYGEQPMNLLWALCGTLYVALLVGLNILRQFRATDRAMASVVCIACLAWVGVSAAFGVLIGNPMDFRPLMFEAICLGLAAFSARTALAA